jgi:hypothetical protein
LQFDLGNFQTEENKAKFFLAQISSLVPGGPYFNTNFRGQAEGAKTAMMMLFLQTIDPRTEPFSSLPKDAETLVLVGIDGCFVAVDNLGKMDLHTGSFFAMINTTATLKKRMHYKNSTLFSATICRPTVSTSIKANPGQGDLITRSITIEVAPLPDPKKDKKIFKKSRVAKGEIEADAAAIFGGLLDILVLCLGSLDNDENEKHRMGEAVCWARAGETAASFEAGTLEKYLEKDKAKATVNAVEASPLHAAFSDFANSLAHENTYFHGPLSKLIEKLRGFQTNTVESKKAGGVSMGQKLPEIQKALAPLGVTVARTEKQCGDTKSRGLWWTVIPG